MPEFSKQTLEFSNQTLEFANKQTVPIAICLEQNDNNLPMIETIVLVQNGKFPFGQVNSQSRVVKVEDIRVYPSRDDLKLHKHKIQAIFCPSDHSSFSTMASPENVNLVRLLKIYEEDLFLHFIFQYVPYSLKQYIQTQLYDEIDVDSNSILEMNSKLFLKKVCYELGIIINFMVKRHIKTDLQYGLLGIDEEGNLKIFIDPACQVLPHYNSKTEGALHSDVQLEIQLREFYEWKTEAVLSRIQTEFRKLKMRDHYVPNFVIRGNKLEFCPDKDQLSEASSDCLQEHSDSLFTDRCQSVSQESELSNSIGNTRGTHANVFSKMKKHSSYNPNGQQKKSNKEKIEENIRKLQNLRKKSKKINEDVYESYLSSSLNSNDPLKHSRQFQRRSSKQVGPHVFSKKMNPNYEDHEEWRSSEIPANLRQTHMPKGRAGKSPSKLSQTIDGKRSRSSKNHKSSFQFNPKRKESAYFNHNKSFDEGNEESYRNPNIHQTTKSIRIQLEQTTRNNKERKNSYKVKILTCQEMEMDGQNVEEFMFNAMHKNFDPESTQQESGSFSNEQSGEEQFASQHHDSASESPLNKSQEPEEQRQAKHKRQSRGNLYRRGEGDSDDDNSAYQRRSNNAESMRSSKKGELKDKSGYKQMEHPPQNRFGQTPQNINDQSGTHSVDQKSRGDYLKTSNGFMARSRNSRKIPGDITSRDVQMLSSRSKSGSKYVRANVFGLKRKDQQQQAGKTAFKQSGLPIKSQYKAQMRESNSQQKNIFDKYYQQFGQEQKNSKALRSQQLEEKIRAAKQKAELVLSKYMNTKKMGSKNSNSKAAL